MAWPPDPMVVLGAAEAATILHLVVIIQTTREESLYLFLFPDWVRLPTEDYLKGLVLQELLIQSALVYPSQLSLVRR